jgi:SNF2 family DNA or RNA helicase
MLRRTKGTILNGKPLLELPDRIVNNVSCAFDPEEQHFYDNIQTLVQNRLEKLQREGGMSSNYTSVLVLLLRLRQGKQCSLRTGPIRC